MCVGPESEWAPIRVEGEGGCAYKASLDPSSVDQCRKGTMVTGCTCDLWVGLKSDSSMTPHPQTLFTGTAALHLFEQTATDGSRGCH